MKYTIYHSELGENRIGIEICSQPPQAMPKFVIDGLCEALTRSRVVERYTSHVGTIDLTRNDTEGTAFMVMPNAIGDISCHTSENVARQIAGLLSPGHQIEVEVLAAPEQYTDNTAG